MYKFIISIFFSLFICKSIAAPTIVYCNGTSNYKVNEELDKNKSLTIGSDSYILIFNTNHSNYIDIKTSRFEKKVFNSDSLIKILEKSNLCNPELLNQSLKEINVFKTLKQSDFQITTKANTYRCNFGIYTITPQNKFDVYGKNIFIQWILADSIKSTIKINVNNIFDENIAEIYLRNSFISFTKYTDDEIVIKPRILANPKKDCMDDILINKINNETAIVISKLLETNCKFKSPLFSKFLKIKILEKFNCFIDANFEWQFIVSTNTIENLKLGYRKFLLDNGAVEKTKSNRHYLIKDSDIMMFEN